MYTKLCTVEARFITLFFILKLSLYKFILSNAVLYPLREHNFKLHKLWYAGSMYSHLYSYKPPKIHGNKLKEKFLKWYFVFCSDCFPWDKLMQLAFVAVITHLFIFVNNNNINNPNRCDNWETLESIYFDIQLDENKNIKQK